MDKVFEYRLNQLVTNGLEHSIRQGLKGLEKESLRITRDGKISQSPHPAKLGSALTHPYITTDYSEALLEFITPPFNKTNNTLIFLKDIHQFVYDNLDDELLLATSMPCAISGDESVPIAEYGSSNIGKMKHIYRRGLGYRYGRTMQTIAGIHFNYSLPVDFWPLFQNIEKNNQTLDDFVGDAYFAMIRNVHRIGWILLYLFGASPAICKSFIRDRRESCQDFQEFDPYTWYTPFATSLRMSDIGYKNNNQAHLHISYDNVNSYVQSLTDAIETSFPEYQAIGIKSNGEYRQLNDSILQIENEYYSNIRPKQIAQSGEKPTLALKRRGVKYIEIRSLDIDIFHDIGVSADKLHFIEALMISCLFHESPNIDPAENRVLNENFLNVAYRGRDPGLKLFCASQQKTETVHAAALSFCDSMQPICNILDGRDDSKPYSAALAAQVEAIENPDQTPSAKILSEMKQTGEPFARYAQRISEEHEKNFRARRLNPNRTAEFDQIAVESIREQKMIENQDLVSFDKFLKRYFEQH